ncbi:TIGD2 [Cordylochernes scorpioides]|uniref:TIGD2 n=1 Tax=Cordylochernes scorpioides TaxID=51811 RepID=A0ABY6KGV3_9ARAC|nr:TIGD2 [Cordylochernes scorpioides]
MRFKSRHGIRQLDIQSETANNTEASKHLKSHFINMIDKKGYNESNVYKADETGLYWKKISTKSLVAKNEMNKIVPVIYKKQNNSWMNTNIFVEWWYDTVSSLKSKNFRMQLGNLEMFCCYLITLQAIPQTFQWKEKGENLKLLFFPPSLYTWQQKIGLLLLSPLHSRLKATKSFLIGCSFFNLVVIPSSSSLSLEP